MAYSYNILVTNSTGLYAGGEFYVLELAAALQSRGHNLWVACKPDNLLMQKCIEAGVPTLPVDFPPQGQLMKYIGILREQIKHHAIDIVHTNSNYDRTAGAFAAKLEGKIHVTNVHSFHSIQHNLTHLVRNRWATNHFLVDGVCVKDLLIKHDRIAAANVSVVYLGVNPGSMKRDERQRQEIRNEFGYDGANIVIGNVARLVPFKGQEYLLRAFAEVSRHHPGARLLLIGDGELRENLLQLADSLKIESSVTFAGFRDDLNAIYSAFDIYCHSSVEGGGETFPFAVLQALSQELPVVVTKVGDVAEMVEEGKNGFVVSDKNPKLIAEKLHVLLPDKKLLLSMGRQSREFLLIRFTTTAMVNAVEEVYRKVTRKSQS